MYVKYYAESDPRFGSLESLLSRVSDLWTGSDRTRELDASRINRWLNFSNNLSDWKEMLSKKKKKKEACIQGITLYVNDVSF